MSKILVIAPHPDDETLGCGGSLYKHKKLGDKISWLIITGISVENGWTKEKVEKRDKEITMAKEKYKFDNFFNLKLPSTRIDTLPISQIVKEITNVYSQVKPNIIYSPFINDVHTDHQIISKALQSTFKWFRYPYINKVLMYETVSETEFNFANQEKFSPNVFSDISEYIDDKINTMKIYEGEIDEHPFPRSEKTIRALAALRGSQSGCIAAEAFQLVYERNK